MRSQFPTFRRLVAMLIALLVGQYAHATDPDKFELYDCQDYVGIVDKVSEMRDLGYAKSYVMKMAGALKYRRFTWAVATVYEFQKELSRKDLGIYALGWCEGRNLNIPKAGYEN